MTPRDAAELKPGDVVIWTGADAPGLSGKCTCRAKDAATFHWQNGDNGVIYLKSSAMRHIQRGK